MASMKKQTCLDKEDILYVLHNPDGSIFAELMMYPALAEKINQRRRERGSLNGDWVPQDIKEYGLWHIDTKEIVGDTTRLTRRDFELFNSLLPKIGRVQWVEMGAGDVQ